MESRRFPFLLPPSQSLFLFNIALLLLPGLKTGISLGHILGSLLWVELLIESCRSNDFTPKKIHDAVKRLKS
jgi:hypothetical protein